MCALPVLSFHNATLIRHNTTCLTAESKEPYQFLMPSQPILIGKINLCGFVFAKKLINTQHESYDIRTIHSFSILGFFALGV